MDDDDELLTIRQLSDLTGRTSNNLWQYDRRRREHEAGKRVVANPMPAPVEIDGVRYWRKGEMLDWIANRENLGYRNRRNRSVNMGIRESKSFPRLASLVAHEHSIPFKDGIKRTFTSQRIPGTGNVAIDVTVRVIMDVDEFVDLMNESQK